MLVERLFSRNDLLVERTLDALASRIEALSNNVANANTPGFVRSEVAFEDALREAFEATPRYASAEPGRAPSPLEAFLPQPVAQPWPQRLDGNAVTPEQDMAALAETAIAYGAMARQAGFSTLKQIIQNAK